MNVVNPQQTLQKQESEGMYGVSFECCSLWFRLEAFLFFATSFCAGQQPQ